MPTPARKASADARLAKYCDFGNLARPGFRDENQQDGMPMLILSFIVGWLSGASPALAVVIHSRLTLESCILTIGDFCPVESIGISVVASLALGILVAGTGVFAAVLRGRSRKSELREKRPEAIKAARAAVKAAEYEKACEFLLPYLLVNDQEATRLQEEINARTEKRLSAFSAVRENNYDKAIPLLGELVRDGDVEAQYLLGLILLRVKDRPDFEVLGVQWLALAASRGNQAAQKELTSHYPSLDTQQDARVAEFVRAWKANYERQSA